MKPKIIVLLKEGEDPSPFIGYVKEMQNYFNKEPLFLILKEGKGLKELFERHFIAVTFAEEGLSQEAVKELKGLPKRSQEFAERLLKLLEKEGLSEAEVLWVSEELFKDLKRLLEKEFRVELFIISPEINKKFFSRPKNLKRMLEEFSVPFITLMPTTS